MLLFFLWFVDLICVWGGWIGLGGWMVSAEFEVRRCLGICFLVLERVGMR